MSKGLAARAWGWIRGWIRHQFPERQIYYRVRGRVIFVAISGFQQGALATLTLGFLLWVAYASVNVVFTAEILAAQACRHDQAVALYEARIAQMKSAYDEVNGLLVAAEDRFRTQTRDLESRHTQLATLVEKREAITTAARTAKDSLAPDGTPASADATPAAPAAEPEAEAPPAALRPSRTESLPDRRSDAGGRRAETEAFTYPSRHHLLPKLTQLDGRLLDLADDQSRVLGSLSAESGTAAEALAGALAGTGLAADAVAERVAGTEPPIGGPFVALTDAAAREVLARDTVFAEALDAAVSNVTRLSRLVTTLETIPLAHPMRPPFEMSSDFGPRLDPFTRRLAMHQGIDFKGPYGAPIYATSAGTVIVAERHGAFGRLVEINHGHGFRTRYAHLSRISVKDGDRVEAGTEVGGLGSSGRSTGPHLHYEIWYDADVRDPDKFLKAGRHVLTLERHHAAHDD